MAPPSGTLRVGRYFLALIALVAVLYLVVFFPGNRHEPKLGIDLAGGVRVEFKAVVPKGSPQPTSGQMDEARQIIENRINSKGVTGATVVKQGSDELIVEIPSATKTDLQQLGEASILNFRGLMTPIVPITCGITPTPSASATATGSASTSPTGSPTSSAPKTAASTGASTGASKPASANSSGSTAAPNVAHARPLQAPSASGTPTAPKATTTSAKATPTGTGSVSPSGSSSTAAVATKCTSDPFAAVVKAYPTLKPLLEPDATTHQVGLNAESCPTPSGTMPKLPDGTVATCHAFSTLPAAQQTAIIGALTNFDCNSAQTEPDVTYNYYIACGTKANGDSGEAYLLGHVIVPGAEISSASAQAPSTTGQGSALWSVNLNLTGSGADKWSSWTGKYNTGGSDSATSPIYTGSTAPCSSTAQFPCSDFVGFTLNGQVISAPYNKVQLDVQSNISGSFSESGAKDLAQQLNYGKLPISFSLAQSQTVSATLGSSQLSAAFLAGGIGLILVVIYSLIYYRGLGLITVASLLVSAILTYAMLVILGAQIGFTLDLAGIAGFIVALGITADSFVVFFERIKDEVHEGRSMRVAVPRAWVRARRTILSADTVSFLAAAILYFFASADVQGFAFTLGMSTILDLVVVFLFTHPIVSLLSRSRAFGSPRFTGLNAVRGTPIPDEPPTARSRPARAGRGRPARSSTAVAEPDADTDDDIDDDATPDTPASDAPTRSRPSSPPAGGTAAERAAARRARLRRESGESDGSDTEGGQ